MPRKKILVVEDHEPNRALLLQLLADSFNLDEAPDGAEALRRIHAAPPDLILLDLSLPILDGWTLASRLKSSAATAAIPIVAITAHAMAGDRERALSAGCDEYLTKPVAEDTLFDAITRILGQRPTRPASRSNPPTPTS